MAQKPPFATEQRESDDQRRGPLIGFLTTRVIHAEREPLFASQHGHTPGQLVDARIEKMREEWAQFPPEMEKPMLDSITFEFPREA